jgi:hypothetical protein
MQTANRSRHDVVVVGGRVAGAATAIWQRNDQHDRQRHSPKRFRPLTCGFGALAGLEPAPYGLEVNQRPSMPSHRVPSSLVRSGELSS